MSGRPQLRVIDGANRVRETADWTSAFAGLLYGLYGPDRMSWPDPEEWPWPLRDGRPRLRVVR